MRNTTDNPRHPGPPFGLKHPTGGICPWNSSVIPRASSAREAVGRPITPLVSCGRGLHVKAAMPVLETLLGRLDRRAENGTS
jgi:hypothetical protein